MLRSRARFLARCGLVRISFWTLVSRGRPDPNAEAKIESYIEDARPFARPILIELRRIIRATHEELLDDWKWSAPTYSRNGMVCATWAFTNHATLIFFRADELDDWADAFEPNNDKVEHTGRVKYTEYNQIDPEVVSNYVLQAVALNESKPGLARRPNQPIEVIVPDVLARALEAAPEAKAFFDGLAPSYRRDWCRWITEAKREETRDRRLTKALDRLTAGEKRVC